MPCYAKALLGTIFLDLTLGLMFLGLVWGLLSLMHPAPIVIVSGEVIAGLAIIAVNVPLFRLILSNERDMASQLKAEGSATDLGG